MSDREHEATRAPWNRVADAWRIQVGDDGDESPYRWSFPYFEPRTCSDPPWAHFSSEFMGFHQPLSDYWKAFMATGFIVVNVEEPRVRAAHTHTAKTARGLRNSQTRPYSVAFTLQQTQPATSPRSAGDTMACAIGSRRSA